MYSKYWLLAFETYDFTAPLGRIVRRSKSHEGSVWAQNPHEVHFGHWRIGHHGQRVQSFACVHDGRIGFYQDFHWQRINQCYPTRGACHVQVSKSDTFAIYSIPFNKLSERSANITSKRDLWSGSSRLEGFVVPKMPVFGLF